MLRLWTAFQGRIIREEEGAGMVEYALLVALIGIVLITALGVLATALDGSFRDVATRLGS